MYGIPYWDCKSATCQFSCIRQKYGLKLGQYSFARVYRTAILLLLSDRSGRFESIHNITQHFYTEPRLMRRAELSRITLWSCSHLPLLPLSNNVAVRYTRVKLCCPTETEKEENERIFFCCVISFCLKYPILFFQLVSIKKKK